MERVCPRCGEAYSYVETRKVGKKEYRYAVHYYYDGKRRKVKKCYLGPSSPSNRILAHLVHLEKVVSGLSNEERKEVARKLRELADLLEGKRTRYGEEELRRFAEKGVCIVCGREYNFISCSHGRWFAHHLPAGDVCELPREVIEECKKRGYQYRQAVDVYDGIDLILSGHASVHGVDATDRMVAELAASLAERPVEELKKYVEAARNAARGRLGAWAIASFRTFAELEALRGKVGGITLGEALAIVVVANLDAFRTKANEKYVRKFARARR